MFASQEVEDCHFVDLPLELQPTIWFLTFMSRCLTTLSWWSLSI